ADLVLDLAEGVEGPGIRVNDGERRVSNEDVGLHVVEGGLDEVQGGHRAGSARRCGRGARVTQAHDVVSGWWGEVGSGRARSFHCPVPWFVRSTVRSVSRIRSSRPSSLYAPRISSRAVPRSVSGGRSKSRSETDSTSPISSTSRLTAPSSVCTT